MRPAGAPSKLVDESPRFLLPTLARVYGDRGALVLQQLYWHAGFGWHAATYAEWSTDFGWSSEKVARGVLDKLRDAGVIKVKREGTDATRLWRIVPAALRRAGIPVAAWAVPDGQIELPERAPKRAARAAQTGVSSIGSKRTAKRRERPTPGIYDRVMQ